MSYKVLDSALLGPGIYLLIDGEVVVYVGQSQCLISRIADHTKILGGEIKIFNKVDYIPCSKAELNVLENFYVEKYQPKYNKTGAPYAIPITLSKLPSSKSVIDLVSSLPRVRPFVERARYRYDAIDEGFLDYDDSVEA